MPHSLLTTFGFTELESTLYIELLHEGSATGYRLAQLVGKAPANTYQGLKALVGKGAALISEDADAVSTYTAVPPVELMATLTSNFEHKRDVLLKSMKNITPRQRTENVYQLNTVSQIMERCRSMIESATSIILFDLFPAVFDLLKDEINLARKRGVCVAGIAYRQQDSGPFMPVNNESLNLVNSQWPGLGIAIVVDGQQQIIAQLSKDLQVALNGVWMNSPFLSCFLHSSLAAEIRGVAFRNDPSDPLRGLSLQSSFPPGFKNLLKTGRES